jgi:hypothetical protein
MAITVETDHCRSRVQIVSSSAHRGLWSYMRNWALAPRIYYTLECRYSSELAVRNLMVCWEYATCTGSSHQMGPAARRDCSKLRGSHVLCFCCWESMILLLSGVILLSLQLDMGFEHTLFRWMRDTCHPWRIAVSKRNTYIKISNNYLAHFVTHMSSLALRWLTLLSGV